jgi:hypothetical protein
MNGFCTIHSAQMEQRFSKNKLDDSGNPKPYFAHSTEDGLCFGESMRKGQANGRGYSQAVAKPQPANGYDTERSRRIERQHSQEMSIRFVEMLIKANPEALMEHTLSELVARYTDHFEKDLDKG